MEPGGSSGEGFACMHQRTEEPGVRFRNEMEAGPGGKQIQVEDPDGNPIELFEPAAG